MSDGERLVSARCRTCGKQLTADEFRTCSGVGHYCAAHLPARTSSRSAARPRRSAAPAGPSEGRRNRRYNEAGEAEYPCKAQFAADGVIRRGRLTCAHTACTEGNAVFVVNDVPYTPTEIVTLFIRDPDGRRMAQHSGFACHD